MLARVVPTFKAEDKNVLNNYRPISLTCVSCKLLEHIISFQIMTYLSSNHLLLTNQHGFQRGRSCETQLFELVTDLHNSVHSSKPVDAIFIAFAKAFDCVLYQRLIHKLNKYNLSSFAVKRITNFLANRRQSVVVVQGLSSSLPVTSGVPQGSVLGPALFLIYVNDLRTNIKSCTRLFADDCVIYRPITGSLDYKILQDDLHKISDWCDTWLMKINTSETKAITFTTQRHPTPHTYLIRNDPIENVILFKYLGVHLSSDLTWNTHIQHITKKAMKTLGFLKRTLFQANPETKLVAYSTLVRSQLEYASIICNPHQSYLGENIESLQNKAARFIFRDYSRFTSVTGIKHRLNLSPFHTRRKLARLSFIHKLYHSFSAFKYLFYAQLTIYRPVWI
ncbi:MAG: reverse transcriptase family protein, partial [Anaplasma sp.]|nr:reverse transcriptase family protein [Anaplasma sp.]